VTSMPIIWIYRGAWPEAGRFREVSPEVVQRAIEEDWGQPIDGLGSHQMKPVEQGPHEAADAYLEEVTGEKPKAAAPKRRDMEPEPEPEPKRREPEPEPPRRQTYPTRELRAKEPAKTAKFYKPFRPSGKSK